jgi:uncharacterized protein YaeQ
MAISSKIYKARLNIADMDRHVYADHNLTVACHPSETESRMMLRILAFAIHAGEALEFGRGISTDDEPDLWRKDLTGEVELWIDLGTPDESRIRKACGRAGEVVLYCYGDRAVPTWWEKIRNNLSRFDNLQVYQLADEQCEALEGLAATGMDLQCSISESAIYLSNGDGESTELKLSQLK